MFNNFKNLLNKIFFFIKINKYLFLQKILKNGKRQD